MNGGSLAAEIGKSMLFAFPPYLRNDIIKWSGESLNTWISELEKTSSLHGDWVELKCGACFKPSPTILEAEWLWPKDAKSLEGMMTYENRRDYWKSKWKTPHLAGMKATESDNYLMNFNYDQYDHTYSLVEVLEIVQTEDAIEVFEVPKHRLIRAWREEWSANRITSPYEDARFLATLRHMASSDDSNAEALKRYAEGILRFLNRANLRAVTTTKH